MSETIIAVPIDERAKQHAEAALARLGLTPAEVLRQVAERLAEADDVIRRAAAEAQAAAQLAMASDDELFLDRFREAVERLTRDPVVGFPEQPLIPNAETIEAIEADRRGEHIGEFKTVEELLANLNADD